MSASAGRGYGAEWLVPTDFSTIQSAIDAAIPGDTILVLPGTYPESIDFVGKDLRVVSRDGRDVTTIDAGGADATVRFVSGESAAALLEEFTITRGERAIRW